MPPTCSTLTLLIVKSWSERSAPSATILMPSPSRPLPRIEKLESVSPARSTPGPTMISMTGEPLAICETILAPPRSMPTGPWVELVTLMTIGVATV